MADRLPWFTLEVEHWLNKVRAHPAVKGALLELDCWAWAHGEPACTLPDDDEELAAISGLAADEWAEYGARVRKQLRVHEGRLVDPHLYAIYLRQSSRAQTNRQNGKTGADKRWGKNRPESIGSILGTPPPSEAIPNAMPNAIANGKANGMATGIANGKANAMAVANDSPRVSSKILSLEVLETKDFRSDRSDSIATAMPSAITADAHDSAAAESTGVPGDEPVRPPTEVERQRFAAEYLQRLRARYEAWTTERPEEEAALREGEIRLFAWPNETLTPMQERIVRDACLERLRELRGWPTCDEWIALQLQLQREPVEAA